MHSNPTTAMPQSISQFARWFETLEACDRRSHEMMANEVWAIAKTMDEVFPGFWTKFMENRQAALKQFVQEQKQVQANRN